MAWPDAGQRLEAVSTARTGRNFSVSNRPTVSTSTPTACRSRYQSLTASCLIYDHVSIKYGCGYARSFCCFIGAYYTAREDRHHKPKRVAKNGQILLANLHQSSSRTFSCVSFPSVFAFQEGMVRRESVL